MPSETLREREMEALLTNALRDVEEVLVVHPSSEMVRDLVSALDTLESPPVVHVLSAERPLKDVMDDFLVASTAADLVAADTLTLRTLDDEPVNSLLVSEQSVVSVVSAGAHVAGLVTDDEEFVAEAYDYYTGLHDDAEAFSLRTPPLSRVRETLEGDIGPEAAGDFDAVLETLQTARGNGDGLDEVTISLLVAAKNDELLYDISKWGEDVGLASKATFSRTKTQLEDRGLIDTEKVPIEVGRPRLRLMLGDDRLTGAEADELASVAQSLLT